jgi:hypothetical protein
MRIFVFLAVVALAACDPPEKVVDKAQGSNTREVSEIVIRDAYGDCWLLEDNGRTQAWVPMKQSVCEKRPEWLPSRFDR